MHALASPATQNQPRRCPDPASATLSRGNCWRNLGTVETAVWQNLCVDARIPGPEGPVENPNLNDRTTDRWRLDTRFDPLDLDDSSVIEQAPPLWKDLTLASVVALLLWVTAIALFR
jgi:hypothetical protein